MPVTDKMYMTLNMPIYNKQKGEKQKVHGNTYFPALC